VKREEKASIDETIKKTFNLDYFESKNDDVRATFSFMINNNKGMYHTLSIILFGLKHP